MKKRVLPVFAIIVMISLVLSVIYLGKEREIEKAGYEKMMVKQAVVSVFDSVYDGNFTVFCANINCLFVHKMQNKLNKLGSEEHPLWGIIDEGIKKDDNEEKYIVPVYEQLGDNKKEYNIELILIDGVWKVNDINPRESSSRGYFFLCRFLVK